MRRTAVAWLLGAVTLSISLATLVLAAVAADANLVLAATVVAVLTIFGAIGFWLGLSRTASR
jgi:hypothetical protein